MRCDACQEIFCKDHITYANHKCMSSYKKVTVKTSKCYSCLHVMMHLNFFVIVLKDIQVPVCPLCNIPIPVKRGEMPDIKVGEHIDRDCRSDPAQRKRKVHIYPEASGSAVSQNNWVSVFQIFTNKCSKGGCKQKEMMRVTCDQCHLNFCLKHRHPLDHDCKPDGKPLSKSGWVQPHPAGPSEGKRMEPFDLISFLPLRHAAVMRASASSSSASSSSSSGNPWPVSNGMSRAHSSRLDRVRSHTSDIKQAHQIVFSLSLSL